MPEKACGRISGIVASHKHMPNRGTCGLRGFTQNIGRTGTDARPEPPCPASQDRIQSLLAATRRPQAETILRRREAFHGQSQPVFPNIHARGITVVTPTPSLDLPSAATAPRCSSLAKAVSAWARISCEGSAESRATNPTPQESESKRGSSRLLFKYEGAREHLHCFLAPLRRGETSRPG